MYLSRLFADDTSFSYSSRDELQIKTVIDHDLKELDEWSKKWWVESDFKAPSLPLSLRLKGSGCHYNSI
jgi:hypothetical protein